MCHKWRAEWAPAPPASELPRALILPEHFLSSVPSLLETGAPKPAIEGQGTGHQETPSWSGIPDAPSLP